MRTSSGGPTMPLSPRSSRSSGPRRPQLKRNHRVANGSISCPRYLERPRKRGLSFDYLPASRRARSVSPARRLGSSTDVLPTATSYVRMPCTRRTACWDGSASSISSARSPEPSACRGRASRESCAVRARRREAPQAAVAGASSARRPASLRGRESGGASARTAYAWNH